MSHVSGGQRPEMCNFCLTDGLGSGQAENRVQKAKKVAVFFQPLSKYLPGWSAARQIDRKLIMHRILWIPSICILLSVSCTSRESDSGSSSQIETRNGNGRQAGNDLDNKNGGRAVTKEEVIEKSKEALHLARDLASQNKDEFVKEAKQRLAEMDRKIDDWEARSKPWAADARAKWEREREELQRRRSQMQEELDKLKDKSGDAWRDMKAGATAAWDNLADSFRQAAENFENK